MSEPHTDPARELREAIMKVVFDAILDVYPETMTFCARKAADALLASEEFTIGLREEGPTLRSFAELVVALTEQREDGAPSPVPDPIRHVLCQQATKALGSAR